MVGERERERDVGGSGSVEEVRKMGNRAGFKIEIETADIYIGKNRQQQSPLNFPTFFF